MRNTRFSFCFDCFSVDWRRASHSFNSQYIDFLICKKKGSGDFLGGPLVKNPPCQAGDAGSIPGWRPKIPCLGAAKPKHHNY